MWSVWRSSGIGWCRGRAFAGRAPDAPALSERDLATSRQDIAQAVQDGKECGEVRDDTDPAMAAVCLAAITEGLAMQLYRDPGGVGGTFGEVRQGMVGDVTTSKVASSRRAALWRTRRETVPALRLGRVLPTMIAARGSVRSGLLGRAVIAWSTF